MHITRRQTKSIQVGSVKIGGGAPVSVQSMTIPHPRDVKATVEQIHQLEQAGCELVRVAVPDNEAANALSSIKSQISIPLIADIHFDHRLALTAAKVVDCVRINPGNIGPWWKMAEVLQAVTDNGIPLRVGVNGGSLERPLLEKYGYPTAEALAESALNAVHAIEDAGFTNMKVSLKASLAVFSSVGLPSPYRHNRGWDRRDWSRQILGWSGMAAFSRNRRYVESIAGRRSSGRSKSGF